MVFISEILPKSCQFQNSETHIFYSLGAFRGLLRFAGAGEGSVFLPEMRGVGVESEDGEGSERAVLKRRRRRAMGVWARQEATVIHTQGIGQER